MLHPLRNFQHIILEKQALPVSPAYLVGVDKAMQQDPEGHPNAS
jgi:hypothetical protein